jgi:hypothetical protein
MPLDMRDAMRVSSQGVGFLGRKWLVDMIPVDSVVTLYSSIRRGNIVTRRCYFDAGKLNEG